MSKFGRAHLTVLSGGGGGPNSDGMEERIAAVESRLDRVESKLDRVGDKLEDIRVDLARKPSTSALWGMVASVIGVAIALASISFAVAEWVISRAGAP